MPYPFRSTVCLNQSKAKYLQSALSTRTRASYETGINTFRSFCAMHNVDFNKRSWFTSEHVMISFTCHCADVLKIAFGTIKTYLAGIRSYCIEQGLGNPFLHLNGQPMLQLDRILRGIRKHQKPSENKRLPITSNILMKLCHTLDGNIFGIYTDLLMKAACCLAYFGFLRCGEFTTYSRHFNVECDLCLGDVTLDLKTDTGVCYLRLKASKTDPFRQGYVIPYFVMQSAICPVKILVNYLEARRKINMHLNAPLFLFPDGTHLTRSLFLDMLGTVCLQAGINPSGYQGHSFRIGAATDCAKQNIPDHLIQVLGRWRSSCYKTYVRTSKETICKAQWRMANIRV